MYSRSTSRKPHIGSRNHSTQSLTLLPSGGEEIINPDAQVSQETAMLLGDFVVKSREPSRVRSRVRRARGGEEDIDVGVGGGEQTPLLGVGEDEEESENEEDEIDRDQWKGLPWWRRPSPWWLISSTPIVALAVATTIAARVQLYTQLACSTHRPEYSLEIGLPTINSTLANAVPINVGLKPIKHEGPSDNDPISDINFEGWIGWHKIPEPNPKCSKDSEVQAAVARLIASLGTSMGILAVLTTAWWSQLSDRYGRRLVMGIAVFGTLFGDVVILTVAQMHDVLPGGYNLLIVGPLFDGLLGGMSTAVAAHHAYIADCTDPHRRARLFSLAMGLLGLGFGLGPSIGGYLIRVTGDLLSVFYLATSIHFAFALVVWFIIPESLSHRKMAEARLKRKEDTDVSAPAYKRIFSFLAPLAIFVPKKIEIKDEDGGEVKMERDWNLLLLGLASASISLIMPSYNYKFQYASATFGWLTEQLGYWITSAGFSRAFHLMVILPIIFRLFKPKALKPSASTTSVKQKSVFFDLTLARVSLVIDLLVNFGIVFVRSPALYVILTMAGALGGGYGPAMQSVGLDLYMQRGEAETGKLFGALSVLSAVASQVIGPTFFGLIYMSTNEVWPQAIFAVTAVIYAVAFCLNLCIKLRPLNRKVENGSFVGRNRLVQDH